MYRCRQVCLPTAEDVKAEKTHSAIIHGITEFKPDILKPTETKEKFVLPGKEEIQTEKTHQGLLKVGCLAKMFTNS